MPPDARHKKFRLHRRHAVGMCSSTVEEFRDQGGADEGAGIRRERDQHDAPAQAAESGNILGQRQAGEGQHDRRHGQEIDLAGQIFGRLD